ncbi:sensor histidine kinase [Marinigracilibium pacificum]|uniref:histidine kinase n=1 Tax=Marinigracilibium pacificum TaxID=2729599 RepID=A0A848J1L1_9BACT|nr:sensor histidine kinase [Marinigracilibium pacificum]NMM48420.1 hypothetical protein [Marinigracilibium pacificum]
MGSHFRLAISLFLILQTLLGFAVETDSTTITINGNENDIIELSGKWYLIKNLDNKSIINLQHGPLNKSPYEYGEYQKKIFLDSDEHKTTAILFPIIRSAYQLKINNEFITEHGVFSFDKDEYKPGAKIVPYEITLKPGLNTISILYANYDHVNGGIIAPPLLGNISQLEGLLVQNDLVLTAIYSSIILLGIFFMVFFISWKKDLEIFYFSLFAILWAIRCLATSEKKITYLSNNIDWDLLMRIDYFAFFGSTLFGLLFFNSLFKNYSKPLFAKVAIIGNTSMMALTIFFPVKVFTEATTIIHFVLSPLIGYVIYLAYQSYKNNDDISKIGLVAAISAMAIFFLEWLLYFQFFAIPEFTIDFGYLLIFILNASTLSRRFGKRFTILEKLQKETYDQNKKIEEQHKKIIDSHNTIVQQRDELEKKHNEIKAININLEETVQLRTRELKKVNNELDTFLYRASHDLRRPLTSIQGLCNISMANQDIQEIHQLVEMIKQTTGTMDDMLKKLISISEIFNYNGNKDLIQLNTIQQEILTMFKCRLETNKIQLNFNTDCDQILINKRMLFLIIYQLIDNSINYHKKGVEREQKVINVNFEKSNKELVVSVFDNGTGIEKGQLNKVCGMFYKGTDQSSGNGLGLYLCQSAANKIGGELSIISQEQNYTEVILSIPLSEVELELISQN